MEERVATAGTVLPGAARNADRLEGREGRREMDAKAGLLRAISDETAARGIMDSVRANTMTTMGEEAEAYKNLHSAVATRKAAEDDVAEEAARAKPSAEAILKKAFTDENSMRERLAKARNDEEDAIGDAAVARDNLLAAVRDRKDAQDAFAEEIGEEMERAEDLQTLLRIEMLAHETVVALYDMDPGVDATRVMRCARTTLTAVREALKRDK